MNILLVGGAGYIGSHMLHLLSQAGHCVTTFDNLSTGYHDAVLSGSFIHGDLSDFHLLGEVFSNESFDAVFHWFLISP